MKNLKIENSLEIVNWKLEIAFLVFFLVFLYSLILIPVSVSAQSACTHYASPNGGGNGLSQSSPFQIADFWSVASPGKTLCLLDGIYTGSNSMIDPPDGLSGTSGNPITIQALNDGGATLDGQGIQTNVIVLRNGNDWFVIRGMNAHSSANGSVVGIIDSSNDRIERVVAWDRSGENGAVVGVSGYANANNNVFEDIAIFGMGRNVFSDTQGPNNTTIRRYWGMYEKPQVGIAEPEAVIEGIYNSSNLNIENFIGTWADSVIAPNPYGTLILGFGRGGSTFNILGSILYVKSSSDFRPGQLLLVNGTDSDFAQGSTIKDTVAYTEQNKVPFDLGRTSGAVFANNTEIGGTNSLISSGWQISNRVDVDTVSQAPNIWNGSGSQGARVCKQYVNGTLTNNPLWPWPMDQRIRAALISSGRNPDTIFGGTGNSVTQQMEKLFGTIPAECRTGGTPLPQTLQGDLNNDKIVNSLDWSLMSSKWLTSDATADLNKDGIVNTLDWSIMSGNWLKTI